MLLHPKLSTELPCFHSATLSTFLLVQLVLIFPWHHDFRSVCQELHAHVDVAALESGSPSRGLLLITESSGGNPMHLTSFKVIQLFT